jgi:hypothetical protein
MDLLAVTRKTVERWTKDAREAEKEALRLAVIDAWLNCEGSNRELAKRFGVSDTAIAEWTAKFATDVGNLAPGRTDKAPWGVVQHFDVWAFPAADQDGGGQQSYFGALPPQVVQNLLWFFTEPGDVVVDPFAGSSSAAPLRPRLRRPARRALG